MEYSKSAGDIALPWHKDRASGESDCGGDDGNEIQGRSGRGEGETLRTGIGRRLRPRQIPSVPIKDLDEASNPWTFTALGRLMSRV